mmetsp:Transcript_75593/g.244733  ORF Transcript_75593/g.244733 Transcript_75593/m.244733 type:complete len:340 (+) Transcript_75593:1398-2417(+)
MVPGGAEERRGLLSRPLRLLEVPIREGGPAERQARRGLAPSVARLHCERDRLLRHHCRRAPLAQQDVDGGQLAECHRLHLPEAGAGPHLAHPPHRLHSLAQGAPRGVRVHEHGEGALLAVHLGLRRALRHGRARRRHRLVRLPQAQARAAGGRVGEGLASAVAEALGDRLGILGSLERLCVVLGEAPDFRTREQCCSLKLLVPQILEQLQRLICSVQSFVRQPSPLLRQSSNVQSMGLATAVLQLPNDGQSSSHILQGLQEVPARELGLGQQPQRLRLIWPAVCLPGPLQPVAGILLRHRGLIHHKFNQQHLQAPNTARRQRQRSIRPELGTSPRGLSQ